MVDHIIPVIRDKPYRIIFHVAANDIPFDKYAEDVAKSFFDLAMAEKSPTCDVNLDNSIYLKKS